MKKNLFLSWLLIAVMLPVTFLQGQINVRHQIDVSKTRQVTPDYNLTKNLARELGLLKTNRTQKAPAITNGAGQTLGGFLLYDGAWGESDGPTWVTFSSANPTTITTVGSSNGNSICAGLWFDGNYYGYVFTASAMGSIPVSWSKFDEKTGEETVVADYSQMTELFADMTYDYVGGKAYYIAGIDENTTKLATIDIVTGVTAQISATITPRLVTLACDNNGQLYAIDAEGNLQKVDKTNGALTMVGSTGISPQYIQSMDFDRDDNTLFWAMSNSDDEGKLLTVNTTTGAVANLGTISMDAEIVALHVPFQLAADKAPNLPTGLSITPDADGSMTVDFAFTAPDICVDSTDLTAIDSVILTVNGVQKQKYTSLAPGATQTFNMVATAVGMYTFSVTAYEDGNKGLTASLAEFVGVDRPAAPSDVVLTSNEQHHAILNWVAPTEGVNGGYIDVADLKYDVLRLNDSVMVATDVTALTYTDQTITSLGYYIYSVIAKTDVAGAETYSNPLVIGAALDVPVDFSAMSENDFALWTVIDTDADDNSWDYQGEGTLGCLGGVEPNNDWAISPKIKLEAGKKYKLTFLYQSQAFLATPNQQFSVYYGKGTTAAALSNRITTINDNTGAAKYVELFVDITETAEYNFGWHLTSPVSEDFISGLFVADIVVTEVLANDLVALEVSAGVMSPMAGSEYTYKVVVKNEGSAAQSAYDVVLQNEDGDELSTISVTEAIELGETVVHELTWTPVEAGEVHLYAKVVLAADQVADNNISENPYEINVQQTGANATFCAGGGNIAYNGMPLNFYYNSSYSQMLYLSEESGFAAGNITEFSFFLDKDNEEGVFKDNVKIYMQSIPLDTLAHWLTVTEDDLVWEGTFTADIANGDEVKFVLDEPYAHNGLNLLITVSSPIVEGYEYADGINFVVTATDGVRSYSYAGDEVDYDYNTTPVGLVNGYPNIKVKMSDISDPTSTVEPEMNGLKLYPNPMQNVLNVEGEYDMIEVFNAAGSLVMVVSTQTNTIDVSNLTSGVYILKVQRGDVLENYKLIK